MKLRKRNRVRKKNRKRVGWQAYTNKLIPFLPLKAYPLLRIFGHKPFRLVLSKWVISIVGPSCEVIHIEEVVPFLVLVP